ncbi:MAG TPA: UrcA family protein [Verrucomicrobiae bacterium]|nr:UrcA family protein [Verrucomicrobiae bacterium]
MRLQVSVALAAFCALAFAPLSQASAQTDHDYERVSREVRYGDLDLNSEEGAAAMLARLHRASERVCGYDTYSTNAGARRAARFCTRSAMARAVSAAGSENLSAEYAAWRSGEGARLFRRTIELDADRTHARVRYADLNLASEQGQEALDRRVNRATRRLCGVPAPGLEALQRQRACTESVSEAAQVQIASIMARQQLAQASPVQATEAPATLQAVAVSATPAETPAVRTLAEIAAPAGDGFGVCAARTHAASFAARSAVLGRGQNQAIAHVVDSASVCQLERVVINADRNNALAIRRASALRTSLVGRGVPASLISVEAVDDQNADGARAQFQFAGVAQHAAPVEMAAAGA